MGKHLPVRATQSGALQRRSIADTRIVRRVEDEVFVHDVVAGGDLRMEYTDAMVLGEASRIDLDQELLTLRQGRAEAQPDDAFANALVMRKVTEQARINSWRLERKFG